MTIFGNRLKHVTTRLWPTKNNFKFPELHDAELKLEHIIDRPNVGVCFSGGGTRSAAATLGQLRGLRELGLLENIRYISSVSGGSWTATPFTYLPDDWNDSTFLGPVIPPSKIALGALKETDRNSMAHAISNSVILDDFIEHAARFAGDETYSRAVGDSFLLPFGLDSMKRFFTQDCASIKAICDRNSNMENGDFYTTRPNRPFLIINGTLLRSENPDTKPKAIHFEFTPLYVGSYTLHKKAGSGGLDIGGGYLEPFAFDSDSPDKSGTSNIHRVRLGRNKHRFTLSDAIGTSGAAPAKTLDKLGIDWVGFPEFKHWPATSVATTKSKEYDFGDGGNLENLGIMPLLMRGLDKIIVFVNTRDPLGKSPDQINTSMPNLFVKPGRKFKLNEVFKEEDYHDTYTKLREQLDNGKPVVYRRTYETVANKHFGIEGGREVEVMWVYNERVSDWEAQLKLRVREELQGGSLSNFPHYKTFGQNPPKIIDLSAKQVHMLAHLSCWNILEKEADFRAMLS